MVSLESIDVHFEVLNALLTHTGASVEVLVLDDLIVFGAVKPFLQLNCLPVAPNELSHVVVEAAHCLVHLFTLSEDTLELGVCLLNVEGSSFNNLSLTPDPFIHGALFFVQDLQPKLLVLHLFFFQPQITSQLEYSRLLSLLRVLALPALIVKLFNLSAQLIVV